MTQNQEMKIDSAVEVVKCRYCGKEFQNNRDFFPGNAVCNEYECHKQAKQEGN